MKTALSFILNLFLLGNGALAGTLSVTGLGAWAGKVSEYPNPFDPNLDRSATESTITYAPGWSVGATLDKIVTRVDARDGYSGGGRLQKGGESVPGSATWVQIQAPTAFAAGTVIVSQGVWTGFSGAMPFAVRLGTSPTPDWSVSPLVTGPGTPGYQTIQVASTSGTHDTLRIDYPQSAVYSGTGYADMAEVCILPDTLIALAATATANRTDWGSPTSVVNRTDYDGWAAYAGSPPYTLTIDLGGTQQVDALALYSYENVSATFSILDDTSTAIAALTMTIGPQGWLAPIRFSEPLMTSALTFDFGALTQAALREVIVFQKAVIPEPGTLALLGLATLAGTCATRGRTRRDR